MNLVKCNKGHFYDSDKFPSCPHCGPVSAGGDSVTVAMSSGSSDVTVAMGGGGGEPMTVAGGSEPVTIASSSLSDDPVTQKSQAKDVAGGGISAAMQSIENGSGMFLDDDPVTISHYSPLMEQIKAPVKRDPVVGWLVCTAGKYLGQSFPLKSGRNFVGRSQQMDVCLEGEASVSRDRHAVIIYEPRGRMFLAQPGDSRELFYLNDKVVLDNEKLAPYDRLSVGNVELLLIPFCTEKFAWEDLEKKGEDKKTDKK